MYDNKRLASGIGVLFMLWTLVGLLVVSSGVGVSIPLTGTGGFNVSASYFGASESESIPATTSNGAPAAKFEIAKTVAQDLELEKTLAIDSLPGVTGNLRLVITADQATLNTVMFKTDSLTAGTAIWRGFVLDERKAGSRFDEFVAYAGPNPQGAVNTGTQFAIDGSDPGATGRSEAPAFQLYNAEFKMSTLTADQVTLQNLGLIVQYDPDSDGTYEYGS
jgi:hypothetical protein